MIQQQHIEPLKKIALTYKGLVKNTPESRNSHTHIIYVQDRYLSRTQQYPACCGIQILHDLGGRLDALQTTAAIVTQYYEIYVSKESLLKGWIQFVLCTNKRGKYWEEHESWRDAAEILGGELKELGVNPNSDNINILCTVPVDPYTWAQVLDVTKADLEGDSYDDSFEDEEEYDYS
jgi:hypothetical protein